MSVEIEKVHKVYRGFSALGGASFRLEAGVTCLLGRNGAGKSTLVRTVVGVESPSSGSIAMTLDGDRLEGISRAAAIGWLPQSFGYPAGMTTADFVSYAGWLKGLSRAVLGERVDDVLHQVALDEFAGRRLGELSGGMLRRAGLAAAIVHRPSFLVLDEPTAGLDPVQRSEFHQLVLRLGSSTTVLLATHLLEDVQAVAAKVSVLDHGVTVWHGSPRELAAVGEGDVPDVESLRRGLLNLVGSEPT